MTLPTTRRSIPLLLAACLGLAGPLVAEETVRSLQASIALAAGQVLTLDMSVGEVRLEPTRGTTAEIVLDVRCKRATSRCTEAARALELDRRDTSRGSSLEIDGWPHWNRSGMSVDVEIRLPAEVGLVLDLGVGEVNARGVTGDLVVDLGVGEVEISAAQSAIRAVDLESGIGESRLRIDQETVGDRHSFLGGETHWSGHGDARIAVDVGVGEVEVRLD